MVYGLTFNSKHSFNDFGLIMMSKNRPILPEAKIVFEDIQGADGEYDFSECNPDGRIKYKPRTIEIEFSVRERDPALLRIKAHEIANWLACGEKQLIFDDEAAMYYLARVANKLDLETQIITVKQFTVQFKCRPYGFSQLKSNQALEFGQGLMLGYGYSLDMVPTIFAIVGAVNLNIYNPGSYVKPIIKIQGSCTNISLLLNGKTLTYGALASDMLIIDCAKMQATKNGTNTLNSLTGDFLEFINGNNTLVVSGANLDCTLTLEFNYMYL